MSSKKIAEISLVIFFLCAVLAVFVVFYMHSDAVRAESIESYLNYKYGVTVDENTNVTIDGNEFSLVTSDKVPVSGTCDYFGDVLTESYVNYYYADECVGHIEETIGDCFSDCVIVYDGVTLSELGSFPMDSNSINSYDEYVAATKTAWENEQDHKSYYRISIRVYVRESDHMTPDQLEDVNNAIARLQDSGEYFDVFFFVVPDDLFDLHKEKGVYAYVRGEKLKELEEGQDMETCVELANLVSDMEGSVNKYTQWDR